MRIGGGGPTHPPSEPGALRPGLQDRFGRGVEVGVGVAGLVNYQRSVGGFGPARSPVEVVYRPGDRRVPEDRLTPLDEGGVDCLRDVPGPVGRQIREWQAKLAVGGSMSESDAALVAVAMTRRDIRVSESGAPREADAQLQPVTAERADALIGAMREETILNSPEGFEAVLQLARCGGAASALAGRMIPPADWSDRAPSAEAWVVALANAADTLAKAADTLAPSMTLSDLQKAAHSRLADSSGHQVTTSAARRGGSPGDAGRLAALAVIGLTRPAGSVAAPGEKSAICAARNGLLSDRPGGMPLEYARARIGKTITYLDRLEQGGLRNAVHKNPFRALAQPAAPTMPESVLRSMRASQQLADRLARIYSALADTSRSEPTAVTPGRRGDPHASDLHAYDAAVHSVVAGRTLTTQGREPLLNSLERAAVLAKLPPGVGAPGTDGEHWAALRVEAQRTGTDDLVNGGRRLLAKLEAACRRFEDALRAHPAQPHDAAGPEAGVDPQHPTPLGLDDRTVVSILGRTAADAPSGAASSGQPVSDDAAMVAAAKGSLERLQAAITAVRSGPRGADPARGVSTLPPGSSAAQAPRNDPIAFLSEQARQFELGSSIVLANGRVLGANLPAAVATAAANFYVPLPASALGRIAASGKREAVFSLSLTSAGGELFVGTVRSKDLDVALGAAGGFPLGPAGLVGLGGSIGVGRSRSDTNGVFMRLPRNREVPATPDGGGRALAGVPGDEAVAARLSELVDAIGSIAAASPRSLMRDELLDELMERFPEVSISETQSKGAQYEVHPLRSRLDFGAGWIPSIPMPAKVAVVGLNAGVSVDARVESARSEASGSTPVEVRASSHTVAVSGEVTAGTGFGVTGLSLRGRTLADAKAESVVLVRQDGAVSPFSYRMRTTSDLEELRQWAEPAMGAMTDFSLERDRVRLHLDMRPDASGRQAFLPDIRAGEANQIRRTIATFEPTTDSKYTLFSVIRPDARDRLNENSALLSLLEGVPGAKDVRDRLAQEFESIRERPESFRPQFAFQTTERSSLLTGGLNFGVTIGGQTSMRVAAISDIAR
jgi:hypothetical protein